MKRFAVCLDAKSYEVEADDAVEAVRLGRVLHGPVDVRSQSCVEISEGDAGGGGDELEASDAGKAEGGSEGSKPSRSKKKPVPAPQAGKSEDVKPPAA